MLLVIKIKYKFCNCNICNKNLSTYYTMKLKYNYLLFLRAIDQYIEQWLKEIALYISSQEATQGHIEYGLFFKKKMDKDWKIKNLSFYNIEKKSKMAT